MDPSIPRVPICLHPLAREALDALSGHDAAGAIILGGGVACNDYLVFRGTRNVVAWWSGIPDARTEALIEEVLDLLAELHASTTRVRRFRETMRFELQRGAKTYFRFQISTRTVQLEVPLASPWPPIRIETLSDNLGEKMNALVDRGASRDFLDLRDASRGGLATVADLWTLWQRKNPGADCDEARLEILRHLEQLEMQRPLSGTPSGIFDCIDLEGRLWIREELCSAGEGP